MSVLIKSTTYLNNISKKNCRAAKNGLQCFEYKFTSMGNECKHISQFPSTGTTLLSSLNGGLLLLLCEGGLYILPGKHGTESFVVLVRVWQMCVSEPRTDSIWSSSKQLSTPFFYDSYSDRQRQGLRLGPLHKRQIGCNLSCS